MGNKSIILQWMLRKQFCNAQFIEIAQGQMQWWCLYYGVLKIFQFLIDIAGSHSG